MLVSKRGSRRVAILFLASFSALCINKGVLVKQIKKRLVFCLDTCVCHTSLWSVYGEFCPWYAIHFMDIMDIMVFDVCADYIEFT